MVKTSPYSSGGDRLPVRDRFLPGSAQIGGQGPGQAELGVRGEDQPGPPFALFRGPDLWHGPAEQGLEQAKCVLDVETAQIGLPEQVQVEPGPGGGGVPQPQML